jgi:hypothetical protein
VLEKLTVVWLIEKSRTLWSLSVVFRDDRSPPLDPKTEPDESSPSPVSSLASVIILSSSFL